ncbi:MAG TPA: hypothetical protein VIK91_17320 [Nannocystis sp.]
MLRAREVLLSAVLAAGCTATPDGRPAPAGQQAAPEPAPSSPPAGRTANNDARGVGNQPDYDGEAALLRERILARLPDPLPNRKQACAAMFAAADALYERIEPGGEDRAVARLQATRAEDLAACERETSARAAACVTVRLADRDAELPWLIDQCSRAFPE